MTNELELINKSVFSQIGLVIEQLSKDKECDEYLGYNFKLNEWHLKFRKSKITPTKVGQFVTLWKRNEEKQTVPFHVNDMFDFYIVASFDNQHSGFFLFPKKILVEKHILSTNEKEGKRGFRVYPNWVKTENKQAEKTQLWQTKYFVNLSNNQSEIIQQVQLILK